MVDAFQLGDLQIERGAEFRQVGRVTSQLIELRALAVISATGCSRRFDLVGQCLHLQPVGGQTRLHLRTLARQSTPQLLLVRGGPHPAILQNRPELIVEFCPAAELLG
jgi:hypothetical protein